MNKVIMMARLTKDPDIQRTKDGAAIAGLSIAVDKRFKRDDGPTADFFNATAFGKTAEFCEKYLRKGTKVVLTGRLENQNYTNKDGNTVYRDGIVIEEIEFAESKSKSEETPAKSNGNEGFMDFPEGLEDELPFN